MLTGDFDARRARFAEFRAQTASARADWRDGRLLLEDLAARSLGGMVRGTVEVWPAAPARFVADVAGERLAMPAILDLVRVRVPLAL